LFFQQGLFFCAAVKTCKIKQKNMDHKEKSFYKPGQTKTNPFGKRNGGPLYTRDSKGIPVSATFGYFPCFHIRLLIGLSTVKVKANEQQEAYCAVGRLSG